MVLDLTYKKKDAIVTPYEKYKSNGYNVYCLQH